MKITNKPLFIIFKNSLLIKNLGLLDSLIFMSIIGLVDELVLMSSNTFMEQL